MCNDLKNLYSHIVLLLIFLPHDAIAIPSVGPHPL